MTTENCPIQEWQWDTANQITGNVKGCRCDFCRVNAQLIANASQRAEALFRTLGLRVEEKEGAK